MKSSAQTQSFNALLVAYNNRPFIERVKWTTIRDKANLSPHETRFVIGALCQFQDDLSKALDSAASDNNIGSPLNFTIDLFENDAAIRPEALDDFPLWLVFDSPYAQHFFHNRVLISRCYLAFWDKLRQKSIESIALLRSLMPEHLWLVDVGYLQYIQTLSEIAYLRRLSTNSLNHNSATRWSKLLIDHEEKSRLVSGRFCPKPFEFAQIDKNGNMFGCCPAMLYQSFGNVRADGMMKVWNSSKAIGIRESILDGTFKYCNADLCPVIQSGELPKVDELSDPEWRTILENKLTSLPRGPREINMSYDETCNLACSSCRCQKIVVKGDEAEAVAHIHSEVIGPHISDAHVLQITGSGDPFSSRIYHNFLRTFQLSQYQNTRIHLSTNGLLLNEETWRRICHDAIDAIDVSVDAATQSTYLKNRGGDFNRLVNNLKFIGDLRKSGDLKRYQLLFVVQANNYREMPAFVHLGLEVGADAVVFKKLQDWTTWTRADFEARAVDNPNHPEHECLKEVLQLPILQNPIVNKFDLYHIAFDDKFPVMSRHATELNSELTEFFFKNPEHPFTKAARIWKQKTLDELNSAQKTGKSLLLSVLLENPKADTSTLLETLEHLVMDVSDHYEQFGTFIREHNAIVKKYRIHIRAIRDDTCNICLLSTQMESDPIAAEFYLFRVALAESPTQQSISTSLLTWPTLRDKLRLNPQQSCTIFKQLIQSKCLMVDCLTKPSAARGDSPLGDLSRKLRSGTRTASLEEGLLHMKPDGETESYHSILKKIGANLRSAILSQLSPSQRGTFLDLNTSSLLSIKTDLDPFSEQLEMENKSST